VLTNEVVCTISPIELKRRTRMVLRRVI